MTTYQEDIAQWETDGGAIEFEPTYQILADGIPWVDSDNLDAWPAFEVSALAELLERQGYNVEVIPA